MKKLTILFFLLLTTITGYSQTITGKVFEKETGETLIGVTLKADNGNIAVSDKDGAYRLDITNADKMVVKMIGFTTETIHLKKKLTSDKYDIYLNSGVALNEVTVTASIASARNWKAVGADVEAVKASEIMEKTNSSSFADMLNGRVSGVQLFQTNGKVGMPIRFNVRSGATLSMDRDPIIYVDGIKYNNTNTSDINSSQDALSMLNDLPLEDIATIDVIKGPAAAASYGSEAANGVVVITTKRGANIKSGIDLNAKVTYGFSTMAQKYDQFVNNKDINDFFVTGNQVNTYANLTKAYAPGNKLFFSLNYNDISGIVPGNKDERMSLKGAYELKQDKFSLDLNMAYTRGTIKLPQTAQGRYDAIWNLMRTQEPWQYISERTWRAQKWKYSNDRVVGSLRMGYIFPLGIKTETIFGMDNNFIDGEYILPYGYILGSNDQGQKKTSDRRNSNFNWDFKVNKQFALAPKWTMNLTLLSQIARQYQTSHVINVSNFSGDVNNVAAASSKDVSESSFEQRTWGLYGEAFVNFDNKMFINAGLRRDASNLIGSNVASIWYPSMSVAYNINDIKLRTAYGESGRLPYPTDARTVYTMSGNSSYGPVVKPGTMGNKNIKPERMREIELGADVSILKQNFSLTGYAQFTRDAIIYVPLKSSVTGWTGNVPENIGKVEGYGLEFKWNGNLWESADKSTSIDMFTITNLQKNKVTDTGGQIINNYPNVIKEGQPAYAFYYMKVEGPVFDKNGVYKGAKESENPTYLGKPFPGFYGSFGYDVRVMNNLLLSAMFNYSVGASVYNQSFYNVVGLGDNMKKREDLLNQLAQQTVGSDAYKEVATKLAFTERNRSNYIEKADFLRLSSVSVGYDFSSMVAKATRNMVKKCKLVIAAQNVFLITNYSGIEPQVEGNGGNRKTRGIGSLSRDITNAPTPRTYTASLTLNF